ncbi:peptide/nickel transport system permease protein [Streptomyces sp. Amel2xB2]|uniref:ABC transporter permease subunit n=1 Tax=Streptomyces sp. Amel2xB2 TaxID=1305829 RepID=UPI000DC0432C|nr:ABC transporter permease subunit [Streptomyces sp. Amel2xB2]RAJ68834.1 peptide/nickel transport system permease protein [Streptomyces sp. Amel2xB2]
MTREEAVAAAATGAAGSGAAVAARRRRAPSAGDLLAWLLLGLPALLALAGPLVAGPEGPPPGALTPPSRPPGPGHPLGTDVLDRDVLSLVLRGGLTVLGGALGALLLCYVLAVPLGLLAAGARRLLDETVMRSLDLLLALPGLMLLLALAATGRRGWLWLVVVAAMLQLPSVARLVRAAALAPGCRTVVEALRMQGRGWAYIHLRHLTRELAGPLATDAGTRFSGVLYLLASANFLGLGLPSSAPDWSVLIERNSDALFTQPAAVLVPAGLLMSLCVGGNLCVDRALARRRAAA